MLITPKIRGFICTTAHPQGCHQVVAEQITYVKAQGVFDGPKRVLVIGASTGYGLASRIAATFGANAKTIGVFFEKAADDKRTASAGWYNTAAFEAMAHSDNHYAKSINGDAFSDAIKQQTADLIKSDLGQVDLIVYSLASPRRVHPKTGEVFSSVLKPLHKAYTSKTVDVFRGDVKDITIEPATTDELAQTIAVMGGDDWQLWIDCLKAQDLLAPGVTTVAYSYVGPELTHDIYKAGTIGSAKDDLRATAVKINTQLAPLQGRALISVNKALVTQASAAIPVVPLYISLLYKLMKAQGSHEGCIEQIVRLYKEHLYSGTPLSLDAMGQIRIDDLEMDAAIQQQIDQLWPQVTTDNLATMTDIDGYRAEFYRLFGFQAKGIDYTQETDPHVAIASIEA